MRVYKLGGMVILTDQPIIDLGLRDGGGFSIPKSRAAKPRIPPIGAASRKPGRPFGSKTKNRKTTS